MNFDLGPIVSQGARIFTCVFLAAGVSTSAASPLESVYTDLAARKCRTIKIDREIGSSTQRCPGIGGYYLLVHDDDARQSVTVVAPSGKKAPLDYWHAVTGSFSSVGENAEWRVIRNGGRSVPTALIVRVNAQETADDHRRITSYLAVAKISPAETCVVAKIAPSKEQNIVARKTADQATAIPCLKVD